MQKSLFPILLFFFAQKLLAQVDTIPPVLVCKQHTTVYIGPTCIGKILAQPLLDTVYDEGGGQIALAVRKKCLGTGFPDKDHALFTANEFGLMPVELWARDEAGNTNSCITTVILGTIINCDAGASISAKTVSGDGIDSVHVRVNGKNCVGDTLNHLLLITRPDSAPANLQGIWSEYYSPLQAGFHTEIEPWRSYDPLNGVTTYDLTLISKHILGIEALDSPAKIIAADANCDGKVTTFDRVLLQKLILGLITELPCGKSWRFWPADHVFPNPLNPFEQPFPEKLVVPSSVELPPINIEFRGVKIGDVNLSADPK